MPTLLASPVLGSWDILGMVVALIVAVAVTVALFLHKARPGEMRGERLVTRLGRRHFVQQSGVAVFGAALVGLITSAVDYFVRADDATGKDREVGSRARLEHRLGSGHTPYYDAIGGFFVNSYPAQDLPRAAKVYRREVLAGMEQGFVALDQSCPHLGCALKWCPSSEFFECPCHGSRFNAVGELKRGPSPRGMYNYPLHTADGDVIVDTSHKFYGAPPGTDTTGQKAAGPHCN